MENERLQCRLARLKSRQGPLTTPSPPTISTSAPSSPTAPAPTPSYPLQVPQYPRVYLQEQSVGLMLPPSPIGEFPTNVDFFGGGFEDLSLNVRFNALNAYGQCPTIARKDESEISSPIEARDSNDPRKKVRTLITLEPPRSIRLFLKADAFYLNPIKSRRCILHISIFVLLVWGIVLVCALALVGSSRT